MDRSWRNSSDHDLKRTSNPTAIFMSKQTTKLLTSHWMVELAPNISFQILTWLPPLSCVLYHLLWENLWYFVIIIWTEKWRLYHNHGTISYRSVWSLFYYYRAVLKAYLGGCNIICRLTSASDMEKSPSFMVGCRTEMGGKGWNVKNGYFSVIPPSHQNI